MNFDRLAPYYQLMEFFTAGGKLQRCRLAFINEIPIPRRVLLAGEGPGRSLPAFVEKFPNAEIVVVDSSERMLEIAREKVTSARVRFVLADLREWEEPEEEFDLIVTHFFLDCFTEEELRKMVARLGEMAAPVANWLAADFEIAPTGLARWRSRMILGMLYGFFRVACGLKANVLVPADGDLEKAGFSKHCREIREWGLLKSEWWRRCD